MTENGQNNEVTGVTGRTVPRPLEKSSGCVGAATQVETGRPRGRAVETSADQGQQEEAGTKSHTAAIYANAEGPGPVRTFG